MAVTAGIRACRFEIHETRQECLPSRNAAESDLRPSTENPNRSTSYRSARDELSRSEIGLNFFEQQPGNCFVADDPNANANTGDRVRRARELHFDLLIFRGSEGNDSRYRIGALADLRKSQLLRRPVRRTIDGVEIEAERSVELTAHPSHRTGTGRARRHRETASRPSDRHHNEHRGEEAISQRGGVHGFHVPAQTRHGNNGFRQPGHCFVNRTFALARPGAAANPRLIQTA